MKKIRKLSKKFSAGLLGVTLLASGAAAQNLGDLPQPFVDEDGALSSSIVIGEDAKTSDVVSAIDIATTLGNDAYSNTTQTVEGVETTSVNGVSLENDIRSTVSGTLTATNFDNLVRNYEYGENDQRVTEEVRVGQVNGVGNTVSTTVDEEGEIRTQVNSNAVEYNADYQQGIQQGDSLYLLGTEYELTGVDSDEITLGSTRTTRNLGTGDTVDHGPYTVEVTDNDGEDTVYLTISQDGETLAQETFTEGESSDTQSFGENDEFEVKTPSVFFGNEERVTIETTYSDVTMTDGEEAPVDDDWIVDLDASSSTVNSIGLYNQIKATAVDKDEEDYNENQVAALSEGESLEGPNNFFTVESLGLTEEASTQLTVEDDKELDFTDPNGVEQELDWNNLYNGGAVSEGDEGFIAVSSDEGVVPVQYEVQTLNTGASGSSTAAEVHFSYGGYEETLDITGTEYDGSTVTATSSGYGFQMAVDTSSDSLGYGNSASYESNLETEFGTEIAEGVFQDANGNQYQASILESLEQIQSVVVGSSVNVNGNELDTVITGVPDSSNDYFPLSFDSYSVGSSSSSDGVTKDLTVETTYQSTDSTTLSVLDEARVDLSVGTSDLSTGLDIGDSPTTVGYDITQASTIQSTPNTPISAGGDATLTVNDLTIQDTQGASQTLSTNDITVDRTDTSSGNSVEIQNVGSNGFELDVGDGGSGSVGATVSLGSTDVATFSSAGVYSFTLTEADFSTTGATGNQVTTTISDLTLEQSSNSASQSFSQDITATANNADVSLNFASWDGTSVDGIKVSGLSTALSQETQTVTNSGVDDYELQLMSNVESDGSISQDFTVTNSAAQVTDSDGNTLSSISDVSGDLSFDNGNDRFSVSYDGDNDISSLLLDSGTGNSFTLSDVEDGASSLTTYGTSVDLVSEEQATFGIPQNQRQAEHAVGEVSTSQGGDTSYNMIDPQGTSEVGVLDTEADTSQDLILVGGPDVNDLTEDLAEQGDTWTGDQYTEGEGLLQMVSDAFTDGYDALVVAGQTAEDTTAAGNFLADYDENLEDLEGKSQAVIDSETGELVGE